MTPFDLVAPHGPVERARKQEFLRRVRALERWVADGKPRLVGVCLQNARFLSPNTLDVHPALAAQEARVRLFGQELHAWLASGVEGIDLDPDHPLVDQSTLVALGGQSVCFAAQNLHTPVSAGPRAGLRVGC